jgi:type VI protein secretion system component VasF
VITPGERSRRRARRARPPVWLVALVAAAVVFVAGIPLGMALHDNPKPDLTVTTTKTIVP